MINRITVRKSALSETPLTGSARRQALRRAAGAWKGPTAKSIRTLNRIRRGWERSAR